VTRTVLGFLLLLLLAPVLAPAGVCPDDADDPCGPACDDCFCCAGARSWEPAPLPAAPVPAALGRLRPPAPSRFAPPAPREILHVPRPSRG
jgi:hypothetical protein